ncbi:hypothetical protein AB0E55_22860 [Amycolatopsis keratiniphila]|uniref:hypothetical protein n=1 Tax=Amycolatopsis keratiniphila TaxID=129921 RepID=UPI00340B56C1
MANDTFNTDLLNVLIGPNLTLVGSQGEPTRTLHHLLNQVTLDQAIELLKVAQLRQIQDQLDNLTSAVRGLTDYRG